MTRTCNYERMNVERLFARGFVIFGGIVWTMMFFAAETAARYSGITYTLEEVIKAAGSALLPLAAAVLIFVVGWFYERLAAVLLLAGAAGVVVWGIIAGWAGPLWAIMGVALIGPMVLAAVLFLLASRMQTVCSLEGHPDA
ncbi:MAG: hypothetical protein RBS78_02815 [Coriobacteriia bacterium]|jgi:hypothetical protein|nr:hypothetical protein [Coriobacteriia bacterium]